MDQRPCNQLNHMENFDDNTGITTPRCTRAFSTSEEASWIGFRSDTGESCDSKATSIEPTKTCESFGCKQKFSIDTGETIRTQKNDKSCLGNFTTQRQLFPQNNSLDIKDTISHTLIKHDFQEAKYITKERPKASEVFVPHFQFYLDMNSLPPNPLENVNFQNIPSQIKCDTSDCVVDTMEISSSDVNNFCSQDRNKFDWTQKHLEKKKLKTKKSKNKQRTKKSKTNQRMSNKCRKRTNNSINHNSKTGETPINVARERSVAFVVAQKALFDIMQQNMKSNCVR